MNNNSFVTGIIGFTVTLIVHIILSIVTTVNLSYMFTFYIVWIAFLAIGIGQEIKKKPTNA